MKDKELRNTISKLLVKHSMSTRQVFISELLDLIQSEVDKGKQLILGEVLNSGYDKLNKTYSVDKIFETILEVLDQLRKDEE